MEVIGEFPIFATFKLIRGSKSQVSQPAIFMPVLYRNHTTVTASGAGNSPGVLRIRLEQRVVRSFIYVQNLIRMNQTIQMGQVRPSVLSNAGRTVKNWKVWWNATSETFTRLCATDEGEVFTHGEVVKAHLVLAAVLMLIGIGGAL